MDFNTKGHEAKEGGASPFLAPGIHIARIQKVEYFETAGGTAGIKFTHEGKPVKELENKGQTAETTYWVTDKAWPFSKDRFCIMADKLGIREKLDEVEASTIQDYAMGLNSVFVGATARWKFAGQEIAGKFDEEKGVQKKNWFKAKLSAFGFVEDHTIPEEDSELTFDPSNRYDMERLAPADSEMQDDPLGNSESSSSSDWD